MPSGGGPLTPRLFTPDPMLVAEIDQLRRQAAGGYVGRGDRTGDPTRDEKPQPKAPAKKER